MDIADNDQWKWLPQFLADLDCAEGLAPPLHPLLAGRLRDGIKEQQLFDGIKWLLETEQVKLMQDEGVSALVRCSSEARCEVQRMRAVICPGDLVELVSAIAEAGTLCKSQFTRMAVGDSIASERDASPDRSVVAR